MAKKVIRNDKGEVVPEHCDCGGKVAVFIEGEPIYKCTACGKYYGTMPFKRKLNEGRMSVLYHKSGYFNRKSILKNGLIPQVGPSYQAHWDDAEDLKPCIFLYDHNKVQDGEYDTTYDDDIYAINVKQLDKSCLSKDPDRDMKGCYAYSAPIPPSAIKLVYKGSKKDSGDLSQHSNIYEGMEEIEIKEERVNSDEICVSAYQNGNLLGYMILVMHNDIYSLESEVSETDSYDTADDVISRLSPNKGVIELADVDVNPKFRNMGISKKLLEYVLNKYSGEQFYLRVCPTDGVDEQTLAASVGKYGFIEINSTDNGTFMIKKATIMENKNMTKKTITLNESQLRNIVKESVTNILKEGFFDKFFGKNWAPFDAVGKALLTAAENAIKAIIHDRLKGRGRPISINRIEVAHMMLSDFVKDEDYYKKDVPISCVCKLNWYLTTGNEPDVLNAIKQAYDNIRKKMMAGQAL